MMLAENRLMLMLMEEGLTPPPGTGSASTARCCRTASLGSSPGVAT